ncbi:MAG TPA: hypothetical protein VFE25_12450 [Opitutaceae bacterium]|jgi:hypothetical protein|nr:hypothetical protein [Opitutaceae bacterium]
MNIKQFFPAGLALAVCLVPALRATMDDDLFRPFSLVSGSEQLTAVSSRVFNGYSRTRNADGKFREETYSFGKGGLVSSAFAGIDVGGGVVFDPSLDHVGFGDLARTIAIPLSEQNYRPSRDANGTDILIMVYWGRTEGSYLETDGNTRDYVDAWNAQLMGFDRLSFVRDRTNVSSLFLGRTPRSIIMDEIHSPEIAALEQDRYFVIMQAFDFQSAWRHKKMKLLWETRFSLSERQHDFTRELPTMAHTASIYFGQDSGSLIRARIPEGKVDVGQVKSLGTIPEN